MNSRFRETAVIGEFWRELSRTRLTHKRHRMSEAARVDGPTKFKCAIIILSKGITTMGLCP